MTFLKYFSRQKEFRPKLNIEPTGFDRTMDIAGWFLFVMLWVYSVMLYNSLPESIPVHFNLRGEADGFGNKAIIILLPSIASFIFLLMTILNRFPHSFNYPVKITEQNAARQYQLAMRLVRFMNIDLLIVFFITLFFISGKRVGENAETTILFLPVIISFTTIPVFVYMIKASKLK